MSRERSAIEILFLQKQKTHLQQKTQNHIYFKSTTTQTTCALMRKKEDIEV